MVADRFVEGDGQRALVVTWIAFWSVPDVCAGWFCTPTVSVPMLVASDGVANESNPATVQHVTPASPASRVNLW